MNDGKDLLIVDEETEDDQTNNNRKKQVTVDDILLETGLFGRYQLFNCIICIFFINGGFTFQSLITYYVSDDSPWSCTNESSYDFCKKGPFKEGTDLFTKRCQMHRDEWRYEYSKKYSFSNEFDLVCSKQYLQALSTALFFIGCSVGALLSAPLADIYGRKPVIIGSLLPSFVASFSGYFVTAVWQYLTLRVVIGVCFGALAPCVYIYVSEFNAPKSRGWIMNIYYFGFTISLLKISLVAYFVRKWRKVLLLTSILPLVAFLVSFFLMESPQWLVAKGKIVEAEAVLQKIARVNKKEVTICLAKNQKNAIDAKKKQYSYFYLFNNLEVFILTIVQSILWFGIGLVFYAIALESSNLNGNLYTDFVLSSLADVPGNAIALISSMYVGRKKVVSVSFLVSTGFFLALGFAPQSLVSLRVTFAILGRMVLTVPFSTMFLWTFEIYPTVLRPQGMNFCLLVSRIGSTLAPFLTSVLQDADPKLPYFIMAGVALICSVLPLLLPEMLHKPTRKEYVELFDEDNIRVAAAVSVNSVQR